MPGPTFTFERAGKETGPAAIADPIRFVLKYRPRHRRTDIHDATS
jgi:hypothetical protein